MNQLMGAGSDITMTSLDFLRDVINPARLEFGEPEVKNTHFVSRIEDELDDLPAVKIIYRFGNEMRTYDLNMDQMTLVGMRESKSVRRKVLEMLKSMSKKARQQQNEKIGIVEEASFVEIVSRSMNISSSGKLGMYQSIERKYGLTGLIPRYAIDAPSDATDGSSRPTKSLTQILNESGVGISARFAYVVLREAGIVERKSRPSSKGGAKEFWAVTVKGLMYGKNITTPNNQRETQPHFYESRASELVAIINNAMS